jgi:hypothetical protein
MERQVTETRVRIDAGEFATAEAEITLIQEGIEPLLQKTQEAQLRDDRRNYIVTGIVEVMGRMGFIVQAGSPSAEEPNRPDSPTIIQARRIGGGAVAVSVPQDGEIWYDVDGFPKRLEPAPDGRLAPSCDEAEAQIDQIHAALDESFGIETGELLWQGKATQPDRKQSERLSENQGAPRRAEGHG